MAICSNSAFAFSRLTYAKIPAHTGRKTLFYNVKKLSFSYWYNLFIAVRKTQILLNGSYLPLTLPMKKYRQATMQKWPYALPCVALVGFDFFNLSYVVNNFAYWIKCPPNLCKK